MSEIGSASFGLVVGLGRFKKGLDEAEQIGRKKGEDAGEAVGDGIEKGVKDSEGKVTAAVGGIAAASGAVLALGMADALGNEALDSKLAASLNIDPAEAERAGNVAGNLWANGLTEGTEEAHAAVASVMSSLGDFAKTDKDLERLTGHALNFATAFDTDVNEAVGNAGILLETGLAKDADHAFDLMTAGIQNVPVAFRDELTAATHEYSQFFAGLGFSGEETMAILSEAAKGGTYMVDKVADSLAELRKTGMDGSATRVDAYKALGLSATQMATDIASGGAKAQAATQQIVKALLSVEDPAKKGQLAIALFGTPFEDITGDGAKMDQVLQSLAAGGLTDVDGRAAKMGATLNDNAKSNLTAFGRGLRQDIGDAIDNHVLPAIDGLPGPLKGAAVGFGVAGGAAAEMAGDFGPAMLAMKSMGNPLSGAAGKLKSVGSSALTAGANVAKGAASMAASGAKAAASTVATSAKVVGGWIAMGAQSLLAAAKVAAAWLISMGPALLVAAIVAGIVFLVIKHWDTIKAATGKAWDWVWSKVQTVIGWVKNLFLNFTGPGLLIKHWDTIKAGISNVTGFFREKWDGVFSWFSGLPGRISRTAAGMWDGIKSAFVGAINAVISLWNQIRFPEFTIGGWDPPGPGPTIPSVTVGGWSVPQIPYMKAHQGGIVPGSLGAEIPMLLEAGEGVFTRNQMANLAPAVPGSEIGSGRTEVVQLVVDGRVLAEVVRGEDSDYDRRNGRRGGRAA